MKAELMFNVGEFVTEQALVAFDAPLDAQWPLDEINEALAAFYRSTMTLPTLSDIKDRKGSIGYLLAPRNDRADGIERSEMFWTCLAEGNLAHAGRHEFLADLPRWHHTPHEPELGRDPLAAVAYVAPYGPALPVEPINDAIRLLMGQTTWPEAGAIYLYPVRKGDSPLYSGLWLADCVHGFDDSPLLDDSMFTRIREQNMQNRKRLFGKAKEASIFDRKRYDW